MASDRAALLRAVAAMQLEIQNDAAALDQLAAFPQQNVAALRDAGALGATLPETLGGLGFGYGAQGALDLLTLFALLGEASLPMARLYEAHVNALQLICRYGTKLLVAACAKAALAGELFALWVTDPPQNGLMMTSSDSAMVLLGAKEFCSGAGFATRALVTAATPDGIRMLVVLLEPGTRVRPSAVKLGGMRAAITGAMDFSGMEVVPEDIIGQAGDYLREPVFSAGAWRGSAGAFGGLTALVKLHRSEIKQRHREADPHQQARFGKLLIAYETARLWLQQAAARACLEDDSDEAVVAYVNLARLAVEAACLEAMQLSQRGLGLGAFIAGHPAERICRDLATYLRQPAPDETLVKAARHYFFNPLPTTQ